MISLRNVFIVLFTLVLEISIFSQTALEFNGVDSYIKINDNSSLHLDQFTIECWLLLHNNGIAVSTGDGGVEAIPIVTRGIEDPDSITGINFFLGLRESDYTLVADFESPPTSLIPYANQPVYGFTSLLTEYWYHVALTYDGSMMSLFLNGKLETSQQLLQSPFAESISSIGIATAFDDSDTPRGFFSGRLDEIRIWDYARTPTQILDAINDEYDNPNPGLKMALNLNEGQGTQLNAIGDISTGDILPNNVSWTSGAQFHAFIPPVKNPESILTAGLISDPQYCDCNPTTTRKYRLTLQKLPEAIDTLNKHQPDYAITLGDVIDKYYASYETILPLYDSLKVPHHFVLGNHEFSEMEDSLKKNIISLLNMPDYYYDFDIGDWKFIVLDGTEMAEYSSAVHPELQEEADSMRNGVAGQVNDFDWNGGFSRAQLSWLKDKLESSYSANQKVILYCHWPIYPYGTIKNLWNDTATVTLLENFPHIVAYINGHNHEGNYGFKNGVHYINQVAMVETEDYNSFSILDIFPDKLVIKGYGLNPDQVIAYKDVYKNLPLLSLSDTIIFYFQDSGDYVGSIKLSDEFSVNDFNFYLIDDTVNYDIEYFSISNDSLFINYHPENLQNNRFKIKIAAIDYAFDTVSAELNILFDTTVAMQHTSIDDLLLSIDDLYYVNPDSLYTDYSKSGLHYSINIQDEAILLADYSDSEFVLLPQAVGSTEVLLTAFDSITNFTLYDTFVVSVYDTVIIAISPASGDIISVYPNPANSYLVIHHSLYPGTYQIIFHDVLGRQTNKMMLEKVISNSSPIRLEIDALYPGLYFLEIRNNNQYITTKPVLIE